MENKELWRVVTRGEKKTGREKEKGGTALFVVVVSIV